MLMDCQELGSKVMRYEERREVLLRPHVLKPLTRSEESIPARAKADGLKVSKLR